VVTHPRDAGGRRRRWVRYVWEKLYVFGGGANSEATRDAITFDGDRWIMTPALDLPQALQFPAVSLIGNRVYVYGGLSIPCDYTSAQATLWSCSLQAHEMNWVWLLWNDAPFDGIKAALILFDVELPIGIEVSREIDGSELDDGLCHLLSPTHA
jgi:hypothetical protein